MTDSVATVVPASGGRRFDVFSNEIVIKLGSRDTGGRFTLFATTVPPGQNGPPRHYHRHEDECFYLLSGRASFLRDGQWFEADPGTTVFIPRGVVHTFRNRGDTPLTLLVHTTPGGIEGFFEGCAEILTAPGGPDPGRLAGIAAEHGIVLLPS
ncbi:cupin domain-containing protein [Salinisphaera sp. SPP-AMP-43]|uniref:cupin domain-containing protein n=1 Tax=Salinisphaera sp. SPP-AMP-43 TaxID=3121288 RepID=UPI003C6DFB71